MSAIDQLARIARIQRGESSPGAPSARSANGVDEAARDEGALEVGARVSGMRGDGGPAAFILETRNACPASEMSAQLDMALPDQDFIVETLFDEDGPTFFVVTFGRVTFRDLGGSPFEIAYYLQERLDLRSAEPDLETDFHPWMRSWDEEAAPPAEAFGEELCFDGPDGGQAYDPWALNSIAAAEAWSLTPPPGGAARGAGVVIGHIDTGLATHVELEGSEILWPGVNLIEPGAKAVDPLSEGLGLQPGHGTATSSVIVSKGGVEPGSTSAPGLVTGVAPDASLLPIRAIKTVIRLRQSSVARAIDAARKSGAHVITMSLGGVPARALRRAVDRAVRENVIVVAAAGNCVGKVVFPAAYKNCVAVAAVGPDDRPWRGTSRGRSIDLCAPGAQVPHAKRKPGMIEINATERGEGTSFATALTAGVAALWLAFHGRSRLIDTLAAGETLQRRFRSLARHCARTPRNWDAKRFGTGIIDASALLKLAPLGGEPGGDTSGAAVQEASAAEERRDDDFAMAEAVFPMAEAVAPLLNEHLEMLGVDYAFSEADRDIEKFGQEIVWRMLDRIRRGPAALPESVSAEASEGLRAARARRPELRILL